MHPFETYTACNIILCLKVLNVKYWWSNNLWINVTDWVHYSSLNFKLRIGCRVGWLVFVDKHKTTVLLLKLNIYHNV